MNSTALPYGLLWLSGLACCVGCSDDWKADTQPVEGRVTINGEPPEGALVHLYPVGEKVDIRGSRPWGMVEADGTYTLSTYELGDGAPVGEYTFTITWPVDPSTPSPTDRLGYAYSSAEKSDYGVTVVEGVTELEPIEMTGVRVEENPQASRTGRPGPPGPGGPRQ